MEPTLDFNQLVALFLAEAIRSRRISLARAAEISNRVIKRLPNITSEAEALFMLTNIEKDFQEVSALKQALHFGHAVSDIKTYEAEVKAFASRIFERDMRKSNNFLQDATLPNMTIQTLCLKYPDFCDYLYTSTDKAPVLDELKIRA